jgi:hypothetical protein
MAMHRTYSHLRASDAERERVVAFLREHALLGRLDDDELEERIGRAYAAVTVGDLERLIGDLPRPNQPAPRTYCAPRPRRRSEAAPVLIGLALALVLFPLAAFGGLFVIAAIVLGLSFALGPFLLIALIVVLATRGRRRRPPVRWQY